MKDSKKKGLGRGLSALFGDQKEEPNKIDKSLSQKSALIGNLSRNKYQPRITKNHPNVSLTLHCFLMQHKHFSRFYDSRLNIPQ